MSFVLRRLSELPIREGRRVLVRVDYNVPLRDGRVLDDIRLRESLPTLRYLLQHRAKIILLSHLGRPKGKPVAELRLDPVAQRLGELLQTPVHKLDECVGPRVEAFIAQMKPGEIVLLENVRFYPQEEANDELFAQQLARLGDCYVNDAFGTAHRAHASTYGVARLLPSAAGLLLEHEVTMLQRVRENPARPFIVIVGGAKLADKIGILKDFLDRADAFLLGGGIAFTLLKAQGASVGSSLVDEKLLEEARLFLAAARARGVRVLLPEDAQIVQQTSASLQWAVSRADRIPDGWQGWDIGPRTIQIFQEQIKDAKTIVWAGPLGRFEQPPFDRGTREVARAIAASGSFAVIGGGDTAAALRESECAAAQNIYFSTGGGAALEFLGGRELPPIEILRAVYPHAEGGRTSGGSRSCFSAYFIRLGSPPLK